MSYTEINKVLSDLTKLTKYRLISHQIEHEEGESPRTVEFRSLPFDGLYLRVVKEEQEIVSLQFVVPHQKIVSEFTPL